MTSSSFSALFGVSRENANMLGIAVNAVRSGFAVLPVRAGDKIPLCTLTDHQRKTADRAAQKAAKAAGRPNWNAALHYNSGDCGFKHAITKDTQAQSIFKRMLEADPMTNLAIEVGKSNVIVVDADTEEQVEGFLNLWATKSGRPELRNVLPTVSTPGVCETDGTWRHKNGGHFHFRLPAGVSLSEMSTSSALTLPGGGVAYFKDRVLLMPPSVRREGPYVLNSDIHDAPGWLLEMLFAHVVGVTARRQAQRDRVSDKDDPIERWSIETPWADLLVPAGWGRPGRYEACSCEIWTRPGDASSWKSAVAHEPGCERWDVDPEGHGFMHLWSDNIFPGYTNSSGNRNVTKLQFEALENYYGDTSAAMSGLGLSSERFDIEEFVDGEKTVSVSVYDAHKCDRKHRTSASWAKCRWGGYWVEGTGEYAVIAKCPTSSNIGTVRLYDERGVAETIKTAFDNFTCGTGCCGKHILGRIER